MLAVLLVSTLVLITSLLPFTAAPGTALFGWRWHMIPELAVYAIFLTALPRGVYVLWRRGDRLGARLIAVLTVGMAVLSGLVLVETVLPVRVEHRTILSVSPPSDKATAKLTLWSGERVTVRRGVSLPSDLRPIYEIERTVIRGEAVGIRAARPAP